MKRILLAVSALCVGISLFAQQTPNPVLMTINGKAVTRAEFEYAYNKNNNLEGAVEQKSMREYLDMFINYKLKVAAAEALRMDTLTSFKEELRTYSEMQLTAGLVDKAYVDSAARAAYDGYIAQTKGDDLLTMSHILLTVPQNASEVVRQQVAARMDSIYQAIAAGADFKKLAMELSQDPGSAQQGGQLPTIHRGMTLKEFEDQAYLLQANQMSKPFLSQAGYHIIWMHERKAPESYEKLYPQIVAWLKRQGVEEQAAEHRIAQLTAVGMTREAIMDSTRKAMVAQKPELAYLLQEYYDGLLLYEVAKQNVWERAEHDLAGLERTFKKNKKKYTWKQPHFKGYIISAKTAKVAKQAQKMLKKPLPLGTDLKAYFQNNLNKDSLVVAAQGLYITQQGENSTIDHFAFKQKKAAVKTLNRQLPYTVVAGKVLKKPQRYDDVKSEVLADYQKLLEEQWVKTLRQQFSVKVDEQVFSTVNNHQ